MMALIRILAKAVLLVAAVIGIGYATLVATNVDYRPVFARIKVGMKGEEVATILAKIRIRKSTWPDGTEVWHFSEPDLWPSYFYDIMLKDHKVVRTDYDL